MKGRDGAGGGREESGWKKRGGREGSADQPAGEASWLQGVESVTRNAGTKPR